MVIIILICVKSVYLHLYLNLLYRILPNSRELSASTPLPRHNHFPDRLRLVSMEALECRLHRCIENNFVHRAQIGSVSQFWVEQSPPTCTDLEFTIVNIFMNILSKPSNPFIMMCCYSMIEVNYTLSLLN
jgi:hypothetical protein